MQPINASQLLLILVHSLQLLLSTVINTCVLSTAVYSCVFLTLGLVSIFFVKKKGNEKGLR